MEIDDKEFQWYFDSGHTADAYTPVSVWDSSGFMYFVRSRKHPDVIPFPRTPETLRILKK